MRSWRTTPAVLLTLVAPLGLSVLAGCTQKTAQADEPTLDEVKAATQKYQDVNVALADGYIADPSGMCITAALEGRPAGEGAMGIHYVRPDLLGLSMQEGARVDGTSTYTDYRQPAILIYEPEADGSLQLVGVENLVFQKAWEDAGHTEPPTFQGHAFNHMVDDPSTEIDEAHNFQPHYDLHVWIYRENPNGTFTPFNPAVTCEHSKTGGMQAAAPKS